jgi:8-oxo-dGTP diphosphatase
MTGADTPVDVGRFLAGVGALVLDPGSDSYLLLRRSEEKDFAAGAWECVTGRLDQGEGFEDALHREIYEELGVEAELLFMVGTTHFYRGDPRPENELVGLVYCVTISDRAAIRLSEEHSEFRWLTAAQAAEFVPGSHPSERWLLHLIEQAEELRAVLSPQLLNPDRTFELDS